MKDKKLQKRAARKAHNKQIRLANQKSAIERRRQHKTYHDVSSFAKGFVMDILNLIEYKEQLRGFVNERIAMVRKFRETNHRYDSLSTNEWDACLADFDKLDTEVAALSKVAASLESTTDLTEKIELVNNNIKALADLQTTVGELVNKISLTSENFLNKLKGIDNPADEPTELTTPESTDIVFESNDEIEEVEETEARGSGDYEADVPAEMIEDAVIENKEVITEETAQ